MMYPVTYNKDITKYSLLSKYDSYSTHLKAISFRPTRIYDFPCTTLHKFTTVQQHYVQISDSRFQSDRY